MSANGTHIDNPSAMSEVTDNHAIEISPFDLTSQVTNAATTATSKMTDVAAEKLEERSVFREFWSGFVDDLLGGKSMVKA